MIEVWSIFPRATDSFDPRTWSIHRGRPLRACQPVSGRPESQNAAHGRVRRIAELRKRANKHLPLFEGDS